VWYTGDASPEGLVRVSSYRRLVMKKKAGFIFEAVVRQVGQQPTY